MKDRNITNMITSIISAVIVVIFIPLLIVRYVSISKLGIIFLSIGFSILVVYFILKSIYYGIEYEKVKNVLFRITRGLIDIFFCLILSYFCCLLSDTIQLLLGGVILYIYHRLNKVPIWNFKHNNKASYLHRQEANQLLINYLKIKSMET